MYNGAFFSHRLKPHADVAHCSAIDDLPTTVQLALEEIERQTGWKAIVILGGLEPKQGKIGSHV